MTKLVAALALAASVAEANWHWVDIEGSKCIDGEQTGIWVRESATGGKNLGIYLSGGGACFNTLTCLIVATSSKPDSPGNSGIFDTRTDNPLADYNWIGVPYCTGDVHAGDNEAYVGGAKRVFHGAANLKLVMAYATEAFQDVGTLFVTGESAGGFGSIASYVTIRDNYPNARCVVMDDSGPVLDDDAIPVCLQQELRKTWNLNKNLPADCPCNTDEGNLVSAWSYGKQRNPNDSFGLVSSVNDDVISMFFGFGEDNCHAILPLGYTALHAGLERLSQTVPVYMIPGLSHTHTGHSDEFFSRTVGSVALYEWVAQLIDPARPDPSSVSPTAEDFYAESLAEASGNNHTIINMFGDRSTVDAVVV